MKMLFLSVCAALALGLAAGCSTHPKSLYHAGDETPPVFLAGPVAVLLTNVDGFSARLTASVPQANGGQHMVVGDVIGREGRLIFQPESSVKGKHARSEGGMFFIWNEANHSGYVLSDPLQGYAPASTSVEPTNIVYDSSSAVEEPANGHPCRRMDVVVQSADGASSRYRIWQAEDARHFPVRIRSSPGPGEMILDFSDLRLELPPPVLFAPPEGFVKYDSPVALMNELITRQGVIVNQNVRTIEVVPNAGGNVENWRPAPPQ